MKLDVKEKNLTFVYFVYQKENNRRDPMYHGY